MIQIANVTPWSSRAPVSASFRKPQAIFARIIVPQIRLGRGVSYFVYAIWPRTSASTTSHHLFVNVTPAPHSKMQPLRATARPRKICYVRDFCSTRFSFSPAVAQILGRICGVVGCRLIDASTGCASTAGWSCMGAPTVRPSLSG
jgi:hypothetical protein